MSSSDPTFFGLQESDGLQVLLVKKKTCSVSIKKRQESAGIFDQNLVETIYTLPT